MKRLILANLGTHDLTDGGAFVKPADAAGFLDQPGQWARLDLPILRPLLETAAAPGAQGLPSLLLFVTRQTAAPAALRDKDTEPLGRLVAQLLGPKGPDPLRGRAGRVHLAEPIPCAPQDPDAMFRWYADNLPGAVEKAAAGDGGKPEEFALHVSVTAGTPAMNLALLFAAHDLPACRVERVWHVNEARRQPQPLRIGAILTGKPARMTLAKMMERGAYDAAADLADRIAPKWTAAALKALADIRRCDFAAAAHRLQSLQNPESSVRALRQWAERLDAGRKDLKYNDRTEPVTKTAPRSEGVRALHAFLLEELQLQFANGDYPEGLAVLYRLQESLVRLRFEEAVGVTGEEIPGGNNTRVNEWTRTVEAFLGEKRVALPAEIKIRTSRDFQARLLQVMEPQHPLSRWIGRLYPPQGSGGLMGLRNKSRVGHGFRPVNETELRQQGWKGGPQEILQSARAAAESVLGALPPAPTAGVREAVLKSVQIE